MAILLATTCPERVESLSLYGTYAVGAGTEPDSPAAPTVSPEREALLALLPDVWGTGVALRESGLVAHADEAPEGLGARFERNACTPHMIVDIMRRNYEIDVRPILSAVQAPTLVVHASGDPVVDVLYGRHLAKQIDGARFVELPLVMHTSWRAEDYEALLDAVIEFVAGSPTRVASDRVLATVMFTDIVDSTRRAAQIGDRRWNVLLDQHDLRSQQLIAHFGGHFVKHTGDGMLATFDGPARAVQCAQNLRDTLAGAGVPIRAGLHTGEVERRHDDLGGIAVHIAARVAALASEGEVLVSRTVRDLVVGSGLNFEDRGPYELKGVPEDWQIYAAR
jgi:class 3 adenylate cyclase